MARRYRLLLATGLCLSLPILPIERYGPGPAFAQETAAAAPAVAAGDDTPAPLAEDELEILVSRIALYPDELVALVSSASLYPL